MESHRLRFGEIIILSKNLAEVIIDQGIEMDLPMVEEYHAFLRAHLEPPFSLLINKENAYSYTFDAQLQLANLPEIQKMAVLAHHASTQAATQSLSGITRERPWQLEIFDDREKALAWLHEDDTPTGTAEHQS